MKKLFTLLTMLVVAITSSWADDATYVPQGLKTVTASETVYCTSITAAGDPATSWVVVPNYGTSSTSYTNTNGDSKGNPNEITDNITSASSINMIQIKADGNTLSAKNRVVHMHLKGITGVIGHGATTSSNRGMAIACTEYEAGETTTMAAASASVTRTSNSGSFICQVTGLDSSKEYIVSFYAVSGDTRFYCAELIAPTATTVPKITTDLSATADVTVGVPQNFSIVATGASSYQWYVGGSAVSGATSASYEYTAAAAGDVEIYCVATNSIGSTNSKTCTVTATAPASAPTITTDIEAAYDVIKGQTQVLSIVAEGASSYQWYLDGEAIEGATSASYTYTAGSTVGATNQVYCAATNAAGSTNSTTATMTVVGRTDCVLISTKFSNNAYGTIAYPGAESGSITVPYMAGTSAPTISTVEVSEGATYTVEGSVLTVTAEDGTTTAVFNITAQAITPLDVTADITEEFTDVPSWIYSPYGYDNSKGLKFAKAVNDLNNLADMRIALGKTRQYYFIGAAKTLTLTKVGTTRKVNVYVNGTKVISDTNNDALGAITLDETAPCMVMIESNQTGGDGGFSAYAIEAAAATTEAIEIPEDGVLTYVTTNALDFSTQNGAFKAYVPTGVNAAKTSVATVEVTKVPAGTALLLKGAQGNYDVEIAESAEAPAANIFQVSNGSVTGGDNIFAYSKTNKKFQKVNASVTIPTGKCYLVIDGVTNALDIDFEQATAVEAVAEANAETAAPVKVIKNGKLYIGNYNVAGQQVK